MEEFYEPENNESMQGGRVDDHGRCSLSHRHNTNDRRNESRGNENHDISTRHAKLHVARIPSTIKQMTPKSFYCALSSELFCMRRTHGGINWAHGPKISFRLLLSSYVGRIILGRIFTGAYILENLPASRLILLTSC